MADTGQPSSSANGSASRFSGSRIGPRKWIDKAEYVRLLQQSLHRLGYSEVAVELEKQSGIQMQPVFATSFQNAVLGGSWLEALELLPQVVAGEASQKEGQFLILRQKYHEMLQAKDQVGALKCLRMELSPLQVNPKELHMLAGMLLANPLAQQIAAGGGSTLHNRTKVLEELHRLLKPSLIIPDGRLEYLVEQALEAQVDNCQYHNVTSRHLSLFTDYKAGREQLPNKTIQVLENHRDEVWHLAFSHDGRHLASASKDTTSIIWKVDSTGRCQHMHTLAAGGNAQLTFVAWSPNDKMLLTTGNDGTCIIWDTEKASAIVKFTGHSKTVVAGAWFPDCRRVVTGGHDMKTMIWNTDGQTLKTISNIRVNDLAITLDGAYLIFICSEKMVRLQRLDDDATLQVQGESAITSLALSEDSEHLLINFACHTINLWSLSNLKNRLCLGSSASESPQQRTSQHPNITWARTASSHKTESEPLVEYHRGVPEKQGRFVIRSGFGGSRGSFVVSGSEDSQVYLWHKDSGDLLEVMPGHSGTVNAVSWNAAMPHLLASASDDHTIRIWMAPAALQLQRD